MASPEFLKCACRHCGGHLEFPAAAAGQTVPCAHCGQPTVLEAAMNSGDHRQRSVRMWLAAVAAVFFLAAGAVGAFFWIQRMKSAAAFGANFPPVASSNAPAVSPPATVAAPQPEPREVTNDFAIMPFKLETTPGSSLVYVVGTVRNTSGRQRYGIKVEFGLFDTNDNAVGSATDYQPVLEPQAEWRFKAMVMASKAASARFRSIAEDQ